MRHTTIKKPAAIHASTPANATYCSEPVAAIPTRALARMDFRRDPRSPDRQYPLQDGEADGRGGIVG